MLPFSFLSRMYSLVFRRSSDNGECRDSDGNAISAVTSIGAASLRVADDSSGDEFIANEVDESNEDSNGGGRLPPPPPPPPPLFATSSAAVLSAASGAPDGNDDNNDEDNSFEDMSREVAWLQSVFDALRELMITLWNVSPTVLDEIRKLIGCIGEHPDATLLYETLTSGKLWRLAIVPFDEPVTVSTMFFMMHYQQTCPLDQIIYRILSAQSLTVAYNTYKSIATPERLAALTPIVDMMEHARNCARTDESSLRESMIRLRELLFRNTAVIAHIVLHTAASSLKVDTIERIGLRFLASISRMSREFSHIVRDTQRIMRESTLCACLQDDNTNDTETTEETVTMAGQTQQRRDHTYDNFTGVAPVYAENAARAQRPTGYGTFQIPIPYDEASRFHRQTVYEYRSQMPPSYDEAMKQQSPSQQQPRRTSNVNDNAINATANVATQTSYPLNATPRPPPRRNRSALTERDDGAFGVVDHHGDDGNGSNATEENTSVKRPCRRRRNVGGAATSEDSGAGNSFTSHPPAPSSSSSFAPSRRDTLGDTSASAQTEAEARRATRIRRRTQRGGG